MNDPIEDALRTYPLAELPPGFSQRVMRQIQPRAAQTPQAVMPGFHLTWLDYALGFFLTLLPGIGYLCLASLPRQFFMRLQYQWLLLQSPAFEPYLLMTLAAFGLLLLLGFIATLGFFIRPQRLLNG